jgi:hypothetical protein
MDVHPTLTMFTYVALVVFALIVIAYWALYTRRMKMPRGIGTNEGIAIATQRKERTGRTGYID